MVLQSPYFTVPFRLEVLSLCASSLGGKGMRVFITLIAALAAASPASAEIGVEEAPLHLSRMTLGYSYFNRPGSSFAEHDADLVSCAQSASPVVSVDTQMGGGYQFGLVGGIVGGLLAGAADNAVVAASLENCMIVHGWRLIKLSDDEGALLSKLTPLELRSRLEPWIGIKQPPGQVFRVWKNDAANAKIPRFSIRPGRFKGGHLSIIAATAVDPEQEANAIREERAAVSKEKVKLDPKWPKKPLKPDMLSSAPEGSAIIIVDIKGITLATGGAITLRRMGANPETEPSRTDHGTDLIVAGIGTLFAKHEGNLWAFAVPPGRWRIASIAGMSSLSFCLGSPAFEIQVGEIVYAGQLDFKSDNMKPDLSLERVKAWLGSTPAAEKVRPAQYTNGWRGPCNPNSIYALEFEGAPFNPVYAWGSMAAGSRSAAMASSSRP